jgi:hypothetical protein
MKLDCASALHRLTALAIAFCFAACGSQPGPSSTTSTTTSSTTTVPSTTTSTSTSTTTTTVPNVTAFYGRFLVTFTLISTDPCGTIGPPGTLTLSGNSDGSGFAADVGDRGGVVQFRGGVMNLDGSFSANIVPGINVPLRVPSHLVNSGVITGQVVGNNVTAQETFVVSPFQCTPTDPSTHTIIIGMTGPRG